MASCKDIAFSCIDRNTQDLRLLSENIWKNPELCYEEHQAHRYLTDYLETQGFVVTRGYCNLPTSFKATAGNKGTTNVCVICEYDALPGIGHACGHNLIAEAGIAAGLGLKEAIEVGGLSGQVTVIGTPAEEGGGGKIELIKNGGFDGVSIALMVHPSPLTAVFNQYLAVAGLKVTYTGKAAHAAAFPWEGINALDGAVLAYNNISLLRQQFKPTWRVHGIIVDGGVKPNIIPETATLSYMIRAPTRNELQQLKTKAIACFKGAATATNCNVDIVNDGCIYENVLTNPILGNLFDKHLRSLGYNDILASAPAGSTDMGNVSHIVPSIHPKYAIGNGIVANHTHEFTQVANEMDSHNKTLIAAKAMVLTAIDVLQSDKLLAEINSLFQEEKELK